MNFKRSGLTVLILGIAAFSLAGCSGDAENLPLAAVSGTVTVNSKPIDGTGFAVYFSPEDGSQGESLDVGTDGTYSGDAPVGPNKVSVISVGTPDGGHSGAGDAGIGDAFQSTDSTPLSETVKESGENKFNFEVGGSSTGSSSTTSGPGGGHDG